VSKLTHRHLQSLVDGLPAESATKTAVRDNTPAAQTRRLAAHTPQGHGPWSHTDLLLAHVIDELQWVIYAVYHAQGGKPKKPEPYPRPGVAAKNGTRQATPQGVAYLQRLRQRRGAA
jgi:hypothetical protein